LSQSEWTLRFSPCYSKDSVQLYRCLTLGPVSPPKFSFLYSLPKVPRTSTTLPRITPIFPSTLFPEIYPSPELCSSVPNSPHDPLSCRYIPTTCNLLIGVTSPYSPFESIKFPRPLRSHDLFHQNCLFLTPPYRFLYPSFSVSRLSSIIGLSFPPTPSSVDAMRRPPPLGPGMFLFFLGF